VYAVSFSLLIEESKRERERDEAKKTKTGIPKKTM
jgi:hypothetical protein